MAHEKTKKERVGLLVQSTRG